MLKYFRISLIWSCFILIISYFNINAFVTQLTDSNINDVLNGNQLVFLNFYADWCRFSQMLTPVFEETAKKVKEDFPADGQVVFAKVDCDRETAIASRYHVSKYPTLKLVRYGSLVKREYRGQRSVESLRSFILEQMKLPVEIASSLEDLDNLDEKARHIIGYFESNQEPDYASFIRMASMMRDDCKFHIAVGEMSQRERVVGNKVVYRPPHKTHADMIYSGTISDEQSLQTWTADKCVPLVREITFQNAEELTEEGLPFMILFHSPDDAETPVLYQKVVALELLPYKVAMNFLTADGRKFSHPLHHLGKSENDLPVLAIDSFRHMYLWPHNPRTDLATPGLVKTFIEDLQSGKLHREFHHGPDPVTNTQALPAGGGEEQKQDQPPRETSPPESTFRKLAPSDSRYTLLRPRDEL